MAARAHTILFFFFAILPQTNNKPFPDPFQTLPRTISAPLPTLNNKQAPRPIYIILLPSVVSHLV